MLIGVEARTGLVALGQPGLVESPGLVFAESRLTCYNFESSSKYVGLARRTQHMYSTRAELVSPTPRKFSKYDFSRGLSSSARANRKNFLRAKLDRPTSKSGTHSLRDISGIRNLDLGAGNQTNIRSTSDLSYLANHIAVSERRALPWESCRAMPFVGVFSRRSPVSPAPSFPRRSIFTSITLIGSQDLAVKSSPNLFTHSQLRKTTTLNWPRTEVILQETHERWIARVSLCNWLFLGKSACLMAHGTRHREKPGFSHVFRVNLGVSNKSWFNCGHNRMHVHAFEVFKLVLKRIREIFPARNYRFNDDEWKRSTLVCELMRCTPLVKVRNESAVFSGEMSHLVRVRPLTTGSRPREPLAIKSLLDCLHVARVSADLFRSPGSENTFRQLCHVRYVTASWRSLWLAVYAGTCVGTLCDPALKHPSHMNAFSPLTSKLTKPPRVREERATVTSQVASLLIAQRQPLVTSSHTLKTRIGVGQCWVHAQKTNKRSTSSLVYASSALETQWYQLWGSSRQTTSLPAATCVRRKYVNVAVVASIFGHESPVAQSWFETRSEIISKIDTENCCTIRVQSSTGDRDEVHFELLKLAVRNLDPRSAAIVDKCISITHFGTKIDESDMQNHEISLVQHFYIGTKITLDHGLELGSFDLGSGKMLVQPGIRGNEDLNRIKRDALLWLSRGRSANPRNATATNSTVANVTFFSVGTGPVSSVLLLATNEQRTACSLVPALTIHKREAQKLVRIRLLTRKTLLKQATDSMLRTVLTINTFHVQHVPDHGHEDWTGIIPGMKSHRKREILEKTHRPTSSSGTRFALMGGDMEKLQLAYTILYTEEFRSEKITVHLGLRTDKRTQRPTAIPLPAQCRGRASRLPPRRSRVRLPAGSLADFPKWESCRAMPPVGGFSRGSHVLPRPCIPVLLHTYSLFFPNFSTFNSALPRGFSVGGLCASLLEEETVGALLRPEGQRQTAVFRRRGESRRKTIASRRVASVLWEDTRVALEEARGGLARYRGKPSRHLRERRDHRYTHPLIGFAMILGTGLVSDWLLCAATASLLASRGDAMARALVSLQGEMCLIPGGVAPGLSHVGIESHDATSRRVFSAISRFPRPCIPALLCTSPRPSNFGVYVIVILVARTYFLVGCMFNILCSRRATCFKGELSTLFIFSTSVRGFPCAESSQCYLTPGRMEFATCFLAKSAIGSESSRACLINCGPIAKCTQLCTLGLNELGGATSMAPMVGMLAAKGHGMVDRLRGPLQVRLCRVIAANKSEERRRPYRPFTLGSPVVDDRPIINAVKYRIVSGVVWTKRTMVSSNTDTNRTGVLAVGAHSLFDCERIPDWLWRSLRNYQPVGPPRDKFTSTTCRHLAGKLRSNYWHVRLEFAIHGGSFASMRSGVLLAGADTIAGSPTMSAGVSLTPLPNSFITDFTDRLRLSPSPLQERPGTDTAKISATTGEVLHALNQTRLGDFSHVTDPRVSTVVPFAVTVVLPKAAGDVLEKEVDHRPIRFEGGADITMRPPQSPSPPLGGGNDKGTRHDGNTARLARRSDKALGVLVTVARIAPSLLDLGRAATQSP
ncbi:hypothetical protein PR048_030584 [Dryococelus australis]|uniref:Uncharacterized protein n=1 Tax=Dryococelus australis TaxID=614101 RepID=A0ABQ9G9C9_9NEOP|nr:hypothetical protein PR048_030584 [Dryococelus australis]